MSCRSLSVSVAAATAAIPNGSLVSSYLDLHPSFNFFYKSNLPIKLNFNPLPSLITRNRRISTTTHSSPLGSIDLNEQDTDTDTDTDADTEVVENESGRLYVGNLPFSMTSSQLSEIFAEAGRVLSVQIVYDKLTDRSRGFAFITMGTADEAKEAIRLFDRAQIGGRSAKVNFPEVPRGGEKEITISKIRSNRQGFVETPHKIYVGNLSWSITSQNLREAFEDQPGFLSAKVLYDRDSAKSRGFGFVSFTSAQHVESALSAMNGVELEGRPLRLYLAENRVAAPRPAPLTSDPAIIQ